LSRDGRHKVVFGSRRWGRGGDTVASHRLLSEGGPAGDGAKLQQTDQPQESQELRFGKNSEDTPHEQMNLQNK